MPKFAQGYQMFMLSLSAVVTVSIGEKERFKLHRSMIETLDFLLSYIIVVAALHK